MDGRGDQVIITAEQAQRAEAYLDWVASISSPELKSFWPKKRVCRACPVSAG